MIGLDRSRNLLQIARHAGSQSTVDSNSVPATVNEVVQADVLNECWRAGVFVRIVTLSRSVQLNHLKQDYAISIATIHHLATEGRRKTAVQVLPIFSDHTALLQRLQRLIQTLSPVRGRALIYVWAIEQDELSKRIIPGKDSLTQENVGQDVFVPWVLATQKTERPMQTETRKDQSAVEMTKKDGSTEEPKKVFNRYYHMFSKGELRELTIDAVEGLGLAIGNESDTSVDQGVEIVQCGWERSNYYIEVRRWRR